MGRDTGYSKDHSFNGGSNMGSPSTYQGGKNVSRTRDIEEEEYIYKVPCAARETISLRDSVRPTETTNHSSGKKTTTDEGKNIQLTEYKGGRDNTEERSTESSPMPFDMKKALRRPTFPKKELAIAIPDEDDEPERVEEDPSKGESIEEAVDSFSPTEKREGGSLAIADPLLGLTLQG